jgi:hypothetical protein
MIEIAEVKLRRWLLLAALMSPLFRRRIKPDKKKNANRKACRSKPQTDLTMTKSKGEGETSPFLLTKFYQKPNQIQGKSLDTINR